MYSMRYGTVPVVRAVGGLDDAVTEHDAPDRRGTGFKFSEFTGAALLTALRTAIRTFADGTRWRALQVEGMSRDFSWTVSAGAYVREYRALLAQRDDGGQRESDA
jgi:starch synthase